MRSPDIACRRLLRQALKPGATGLSPLRGFLSEFSDFPQIFYCSSGRFGFPAGKIILPEIF